MRKIIQGIHDFRSGVFSSHKDLFSRLAKQQTPDVLFITCSDSRINPNLITQTDPGDLFILRNAGNFVPPHGAGECCGEAATIEFAVAGLGVRDIIICGHSGCGAIKALLHPDLVAKLPSMSGWLKYAATTKYVMDTAYASVTDTEDRLNVAIQENVLAQLENIRTHPVIAAGLIMGTINLHGWVYKIETGEVFSYNPTEGQFVPVSDTPAHGAPRPRLEATVPI